MNNTALPDIKIASPCHADWGQMTGNDRNRFCASCQKNVYNISAMTSKEASELIRAKEGKLCVRYYLRRDGTILTQDCPVGLAAVRKQILKIAAAFVSMLAIVGFGCKKEESAPLAGEVTVAPQGQTVEPVTRMGDFAAPPRESNATPPQTNDVQRVMGIVAVPPQTNNGFLGEMIAPQTNDVSVLQGSPVPTPQTNAVTEIKGEMETPRAIMGKVAAPAN